MLQPSFACTRNGRRARRRLVVALAAVAIPLAGFAQVGHAASVEELPGDPHSPIVASLAAEALTALDASGVAESADADNAAFREVLIETAAATAGEIGASAREMQLAWLAADTPHQVALLTALTQLGAPYSSMSSDPEVGFDCSGLTSYAWGAAGLELPRPSGDQIAAAAEHDETTAMAGDLVQYPGHVMLYLGTADAVVHSSNPAEDVELWVMSEGRADSVRYGDPTTES